MILKFNVYKNYLAKMQILAQRVWGGTGVAFITSPQVMPMLLSLYYESQGSKEADLQPQNQPLLTSEFVIVAVSNLNLKHSQWEERRRGK